MVNMVHVGCYSWFKQRQKREDIEKQQQLRFHLERHHTGSSTINNISSPCLALHSKDAAELVGEAEGEFELVRCSKHQSRKTAESVMPETLGDMYLAEEDDGGDDDDLKVGCLLLRPNLPSAVHPAQ